MDSLKERSFFSKENKIFNQNTLKRPTLGLQLTLLTLPPNSFTFQNGKHILDSSFLLWQNSNKHIYYTVTFQVEFNLLPRAGC